MARNRSTTSVVSDAGPIIHLHELGCLGLMADFKRAVMPDIVREEILKHRNIAFKDDKVNWMESSSTFFLQEPLRTMCRIFSLDAGEVAALEFLSREPNLIFLTDDAAARLVATKLGIRVHGTIGLLVRAIRRDLMQPDEVINTLNRLPHTSTLHIKTSVLEAAISRVKNHFAHS